MVVSFKAKNSNSKFMAKITYEDKEFLNKNENIADKNKVNDTDLNQIKEVVNNTFYVDYSNNNVVSDANTATETGGYYTNADTTNLPISGSAGYLNVMKRNDDVITQVWTRYRDNQVFMRQKNTIEPSGWKEWEQLKTANSDIVYESILTTNQSTINVSDLDIVRDGGEYEVTLEAYTSNNNQVCMWINNVNTNDYYNSSIRVVGNAQGSSSVLGNYMFATNLIREYTTTTLSDFPSITKIRLIYTRCKDNASKGKISYLVDHSCPVAENYSQVHLYGIMFSSYDNVNSLTFKLNTSGDYLPSTRVTVRRVR